MDRDIFVSAQELSIYLQITEVRIWQLKKDGLPYTDENKKPYPLLACIKWYIKYLHERRSENSDTIIAEKIKMLRAKRESAELENKRKRNSVLDANQIEQDIMLLTQVFKENLLAIPGRVCCDLENKQAIDIRDRLDVEIKQALNKLSRNLDEINRTTSSVQDIEDKDLHARGRMGEGEPNTT